MKNEIKIVTAADKQKLQQLLKEINAGIKLNTNAHVLIGVGVQSATWFVNEITGMNTSKKTAVRTLARCASISEAISFLQDFTPIA